MTCALSAEEKALVEAAIACVEASDRNPGHWDYELSILMRAARNIQAAESRLLRSMIHGSTE